MPAVIQSNKIILFNPRSANSKYRIPNSILQVGASIHGIYDYVFVDGNMEQDPGPSLKNTLSREILNILELRSCRDLN